MLSIIIIVTSLILLILTAILWGFCWVFSQALRIKKNIFLSFKENVLVNLEEKMFLFLINIFSIFVLVEMKKTNCENQVQIY